MEKKNGRHFIDHVGSGRLFGGTAEHKASGALRAFYLLAGRGVGHHALSFSACRVVYVFFSDAITFANREFLLGYHALR